ncbi:MAG TPA: sugar ABC transporter permease, partial [bacterium]|nr:sugar ABC transporter permease [bacterium]
MKLKSLNYKKKNILMSYIAISPWLIGFAVFFAFPLLFSIVLSFLKWSFNGSTFIWLDNYKEA